MSDPKKVLVDVALIIGGAAVSTLFVSTGGNGQNPLPVAAGMLFMVLITGVVAFALAWIVRTVAFAIASNVVIIYLASIVFFVWRVASIQHVDEHTAEELYLLPVVFVVYTGPTVVLSSIGFGRLASRFFRNRRAAT